MPPSVNHSLLETVESAFQALSAGPDPLTLDGAILGQGLPPGPVTLNDVRSLLLSRPQPEVLDAVWRALAGRVRQETDRETWLVAAIGVMLPGLRGISQRQGWGSWMDREDLDSEAVAGLLAELSRADPGAGGLAQRLWWAAFRGAHSARTRSVLAERQLAPNVGERTHSSTEMSGHPDVALARLCWEGIISAAEGDLIGRTRLEGEPLAVAARRLGISYEACAKRRGRAERRVLERLTESAAEPGPVVRCLPSGRTGGVFTDPGLLAA